MFKKFLILAILIQANVFCKAPNLTVVLVVDQFAYHYIQKLSPYFTHGFKLLLENGINFQNAYHPHAAPTTATGHVTISTGAFAKDHGVVLNSWNENGRHVKFAQDDSAQTVGLTKKGVADYGFSAHQIMTDNISDQMIINSRPDDPNYVYSLSLKARSAIGMAGKLGKAIWYDSKQKIFTSSKAYFEKIPTWLTKFNKENNVAKIKEINWSLSYPRGSEPYKFFNIQNYQFCKSDSMIAGKLLKTNQQNISNVFQKTPFGNEILLSMGRRFIDSNVERMNSGKTLLWISLSSLDKIGHEYGPYSLEVIDMIYNLDVQLETFIRHAQDRFGASNVLFLLTADHGVAPIPEVMKEGGFDSAKRLNSKQLTADLNNLVNDKFEVDGLIKEFRTNQFYFDKQVFNKQTKIQKKEIIGTIRDYLLRQPTIKNCWTQEELLKIKYSKNYYEQLYKNQLYTARSGDLILMPQPYCSIIKYHKGATHRTPYEYDTHVPLIFYQEDGFDHKVVLKKVCVTQIASTLAKILDIPAPATANPKVLPFIFE